MTNFLPVLMLDVGVAVAGYFLCLGWARRTSRLIDENGKLDSYANSFLMKMWGGIGIFGVACYFLMK